MKTEHVSLIGGRILPARYMVLALRLALGWFFIQAAYLKMTAEGGWTAGGYLAKATGPLDGFFNSLAGNGVVDGFVIVGELLIGIALVLGAATRFTVLAGSVLVALIFLTRLPPPGGWITIQVLVFMGLNMLAAAAAGTFMGVDALVDRVERRVPVLKYLLK